MIPSGLTAPGGSLSFKVGKGNGFDLFFMNNFSHSLRMVKLASHHQIICITHQPQVAAKGTSHFYVFKEEGKDGRIKTQLKLLAQAERVDAIARMIGGEQPSKAAIDNAKELVEA